MAGQIPTEEYQQRSSALAILVAALLFTASPEAFAQLEDKTQKGLEATVNLAEAVLVAPEAEVDPVQAKAVEMLQDEIQSRTGLLLKLISIPPEEETPSITLGTPRALKQLGISQRVQPPAKPDAYALWVDSDDKDAARIIAVGYDSRGVLYAAGKLLRLLSMRSGKIGLERGTSVVTAPASGIRGHHIGCDPPNNTYDAWDLDQFEQHSRDLIVFGANAVEFCPPLDPDAPPSPKMVLPPREMHQQLTSLISSYGLDVWFFTAVREDLQEPEEAEKALEVRKRLFQDYSSIDALFVPGGDPGKNAPQDLMPFLADLAEELHKVHPDAELWVSNQGFDDDENDFFFEYLQEEDPDWLAGLVYGPWTHMSLPEARKRLPDRYRLRRYPDITHCARCQYPVPNWDRAFHHTLGREPYNPRPRAMKTIHNLYTSLADGSIPYSEGVNDDVNKIVWSALDWDPTADVDEILREYGRYFVGEAYEESVAEGLLRLERNWEGPLLENDGVDQTLAFWETLEKGAGDQVKTNWRFLLPVFRACYDSFIRQRLAVERKAETEACTVLSRACEAGSEDAIAKAREALAKPDSDPVAPQLRKRIERLGDELNRQIGIQLSVERHGASGAERGAMLDGLDGPLNDRTWLESEFDRILSLSEEEGLRRMEEIVTWEKPRPSCFYDDLGNIEKQPHLIQPKSWEEDPGFLESPQNEFTYNKPGKLSWQDQGQTLYETPLQMRYDGLNSATRYQLRVVYAGRYKATVRLEANGKHEIHGPMEASTPPVPQEFDIPPEAIVSGTLTLSWYRVHGRGCQVAEVWLLPIEEPPLED